jgi:methylmalonyl-CoA/ethylmalonyl-CoA epimerase
LLTIDHIGIAVTDLDAALERWLALLGLNADQVERHDVAHARMTMAVLPAGGAKIELMAPWDAESVIYNFIEKRGPGIHHICFATSDIGTAWTKVKASGLKVLDEEPRESLGELIAFLHPKSMEGVLIEFKES